MSIISGAAASALQVAQETMRVLANNISNVKTTGFKSLDPATADLFYQTLVKAGGQENAGAPSRPVNVQIGAGSQVVGTTRNLAQGEFHSTNNPLDFAILGSGYFQVTLPDGTQGYTRSGKFERNKDTGALTTITGEPIEADGTIPTDVIFDEKHIKMLSNGVITLYDKAYNPIGTVQLKLYNFPNEHGLEAIGNNILISTDGSGDAFEVTDLNNKFKQGALEDSNVKLAEELIKIMETSSLNSAASRLMKAEDDMWDSILKIKS